MRLVFFYQKNSSFISPNSVKKANQTRKSLQMKHFY